MNDALETLYALSIIYWCRQDKPAQAQIRHDIAALKQTLFQANSGDSYGKT